MKIRELKIEGFKSIRDITISEPNPFSVFVGPNAAGKSNIFEAIELMEMCNIMHPFDAIKLFGNANEIVNNKLSRAITKINLSINLGDIKPRLALHFDPNDFSENVFAISFNHLGSLPGVFEFHSNEALPERLNPVFAENKDFKEYSNFSRIFVNNRAIVKRIIQDDSRLNSDASNLEKVLKRILKNEIIREEILEILQLLIPGFSNIDVKTEELSGSDNLLVYETHLDKPLNKRLISDGTYNIIALIAAIYQSETPQFLCIEEPENGLNPKVIRELVKIIRQKCEEKGHYIWLNTHSQTLVSELTTDEIILVDKVNGETQVKQVKGIDLHGMRMDEALLTNTLGGGIPW